MAARFVIGQYTVHWLAAGNFSQHKERIMMVLLLISQTFLFPFFILTGRLSRILLECRTEITRSGKSGLCFCISSIILSIPADFSSSLNCGSVVLGSASPFSMIALYLSVTFVTYELQYAGRRQAPSANVDPGDISPV